jgi:hypothetical protein
MPRGYFTVIDGSGIATMLCVGGVEPDPEVAEAGRKPTE